MFQQITILGVGMIGASLGHACRSLKLAEKVVGLGRNEQNLKDGVEVGALDAYSTNLAEAVKDADLIVVCTALDAIVPLIQQAVPHLKSGAIITDAGSTKGQIVRDINEFLPESISFVGGHPIAGSEKTGAKNLVHGLYEGAYTIITPYSSSPQEKNSQGLVATLWKRIGSKVVFMDVNQHDDLLARISHLPHAVAYSLVNCIEGLQETHIDIAAGGFRDITRIAASDPQLWTSIAFSNKAAMLKNLVVMEENLKKVREAIEGDDPEALLGIFTKAQEVKHKYFLGKEKCREKAEYDTVITIDGPAGSGKSTLAKLLAQKMGITFLDTGAIYRCVALHCMEKEISLEEENEVVSEMKNVDIAFKFVGETNHVLLNGNDVSKRIREEDVSAGSSAVSRIPGVRAGLLDFQRNFARRGWLVCEGRDTGSVVFPNALYKFYFDADVEVRARRRHLESSEDISLSEIEQKIASRDKSDSERTAAPLTIPEDAIYIDTAKYSIDELLSLLVKCSACFRQ